MAFLLTNLLSQILILIIHFSENGVNVIMIKMIMTDPDHTLLGQDGSISSYTLKVIEV